jgi:uncharacterized protein (DUF433 family)
VQLEDYLDVQSPVQIRVSGHRIGIEIILGDYLEEGMSAEEIAWRYPTLTLEEVHAVLAYYWRNKGEMEAYLQRVRNLEDRMLAEQERDPSPAVQRLYQIIREHREQEYGARP